MGRKRRIRCLWKQNDEDDYFHHKQKRADWRLWTQRYHEDHLYELQDDYSDHDFEEDNHHAYPHSQLRKQEQRRWQTC